MNVQGRYKSREARRATCRRVVVSAFGRTREEPIVEIAYNKGKQEEDGMDGKAIKQASEIGRAHV